MVANGNPHKEGTPAHAEYYGLIDRVVAAGWGGSAGNNENPMLTRMGYYTINFYLTAPDRLKNITPEELARVLNLNAIDIETKEPGIVPGYNITQDPEDGRVELRYEGLYDNHPLETLAGLAALAGSEPTE